MHTEEILGELDREIARLQQIRSLLVGESTNGSLLPVKRKPGRPAGSGKLSLQGRKRIAAAMKKSWAERKKRAAAAAR